MGDRAPAALTIHQCPLEQAWKVWGLVERYFDEQEWRDPLEAPLVLGRTYTDSEANADLASELQPLLDEIPGIAYSLSVDGFSEYSADIVYRTPNLGTFWGAGNNGGQVVLTYEQVSAVVGDSTTRTVLDRIGQIYGVPWEKEVAAMSKLLASMPEGTRALDVTKPGLDGLTYGTQVRLGHPANNQLATRTNDDLTPWRYVHNGAPVDSDSFRAGWEIIYQPEA